MVHNYKRKTKQAAWSEEDMKKAMEEAKTTTIKSASVKYGIPVGTLHRHIKKGDATKTLGRFRPVFDASIEQEIYELAVELDGVFFGLTIESLKDLAFQLAKQNNIPHPFKGEQAGKAWVEGFMKRHPQLSFRHPEPTSIARCSAFNRTQVGRFYDNLWHVLSQHNFMCRPDDIYNMDETGVKTSAGKPPRVISVKGKRQVGVVASNERGQLTTVICACSATGRFIPPCFIFGQRKRMNDRLLDGAQAWCSDSGWINNANYNNWLQMFIETTRPTKEKPVLLILDNHASHQNLEGLTMAKDKHVIIVSIPPHTSHKVQPLDISVYGPFKAAFERAVDTFQKNHPSRRITQFDVAKLVRNAFEKSATVQNATAGFQKAGIFPYNRDIFTDLDFAPSTVYENEPVLQPDHEPNLQNMEPGISETIDQDCTTEITELVGGQELPEQNSIVEDKCPTPSMIDNEDWNQPSTSATILVSPKQIIPMPKVTPAIKKRRVKAQKSEILTSSPYKAALEEKAENKRKLDSEQNDKNKKVPKIKLENKENKENQNIKKNKSKGKGKKTKYNQQIIHECSFCGEVYQDPPTEEWVQCQHCLEWSHELCGEVVGTQFRCINCVQTHNK